MNPMEAAARIGSPELAGGGGGGGGEVEESGGKVNLTFWSDELFVENIYLKTATPIYPQFKNNNKADILPKRLPMPKRKARISTQIFAAFAANMGALALGSVLSWTATALPSMRKTSEGLNISGSEGSWIGSIATLGAVAACPFAGYGITHFGRRKTMLILTLPFILGWLLIYYANSVGMIYGGRFLTGFCSGAFTLAAPVFIAETSAPNIRGGLASSFDLMNSVGMLYIFTVGAFVEWQNQALICGIIPIVFHMLMLFVPESPRYLVEQRNYKQATKALTWLSGLSVVEVEDDLRDLVTSVIDSKSRPVTIKKILFKMSVLKPILVCIGIMFFLTMSGYDAVTFYTVDIFKSAETSINPAYSAIILGVIQVIATIPAAFIVDKCGRRILLILSEFFMCLSLAVMGAYFFMKRPEICAPDCETLNFSWLPLISLTIFIISYSIGIGPLCLAMIGELLPPHIKGLASCIVLMFRWILGFAVTKLFEDSEILLGTDGCYWLFSASCFVGCFFVYFCVPETKGKNLDEIQRFFVSAQKLKEEEQEEELERKAMSRSI